MIAALDTGAVPPSLSQGAQVDPLFISIIRESINSDAARSAGWRVEQAAAPLPLWIRVFNSLATPPEQGWKLHVTAVVSSAEAVLRQAVPVLLAEGANFKVVASSRLLEDLNCGGFGASQVGKFITIYPNNDEQAVRIALELDRVTRGLRGPSIPSDRPLLPGSLVHYRYGGFDGRRVRLQLGLVLPAISTPEGKLIPDHRETTYVVPPWVVDPFIAAGVATPLLPRSPLIGRRYLVASTLHETPRGAVYLAMDTVDPKCCILKEAYRDAYLDASGRDARDRLRHEATVLDRLAPDPRFPTSYGLIEEGDAVFLAMEDVTGETMEVYVQRMLAQGLLVPSEQVVSWGQELAGILGSIHAGGFIYRDLKSPNVIVMPDGQLRLIDFEIAYERSARTPPFGRGTRGYMSPQQEAGAPPVVTDDIYSLGAFLYYVSTGVEPSHHSHPFALLERPIRALNPLIGPQLADVITRCLAPDPNGRFVSMEAVIGALTLAGSAASAPPPSLSSEPAHGSEEEARHHLLGLARRLGDTLCQAAQRSPSGQVATWSSVHPVGAHSCDINTGSAGAVLALAELVSEFQIPAHAEVLMEGAQGLVSESQLEGFPPLPGLYVGLSGVGAALLRAGQVLKRSEFISKASECGLKVAQLPHTSSDLFHGTAGRLRFHVLLWDETADPEQIHHAIKAGEVLLSAAVGTEGGGLCWPIPPDAGTSDGLTYLGYAHGAAGIGDALLDLFDVTGEHRFLAGAHGAARWLQRLALPVRGGGLVWPATVGGEPAGGVWCNGAAGIGRFFLHLSESGPLPGTEGFATQAAWTVAHRARWIGPTQCHGLAGSIEFLLDMFQATGTSAYLSEAHCLVKLLEALRVERDGVLLWPSESPTTFSPDYMVGYAGVAMCLLRMGHPTRLPHQLSRRGFRFGPSPSSRSETS